MDILYRMEIASEAYDDYSLAFDESTSLKKSEGLSEKFFYITEEVNSYLNHRFKP